MKKKSVESHRILVEVYDDHALAEQMCQSGLHGLKVVILIWKMKKDLERHHNPTQMQKELAKTLGVTQPDIFPQLKEMGMWVQNVWNLDHASSSISKPNIHGQKITLCIWWDQLGVEYYELLQPYKRITREVYRKQLIRNLVLLPTRLIWPKCTVYSVQKDFGMRRWVNKRAACTPEGGTRNRNFEEKS
ncbi:hypothetical protein LAZ67_X000630 [Cordylochernes scorpioides]|uniref:Uncharacterized protein n=1 Tax=Cordylochernes scorpioides TaxID=51811 RepID=A0ABY6LS73_9ARAC|nr:hypothetical protein LAZ67_X000630 [Cordylochernes scorpioides]